MMRPQPDRLAFLLNDGIHRLDTSDAAYRPDPKSRRLLATLPDDSVPRSLILLGPLIGQMSPVVSAAEHDGVMWPLHEETESLVSKRRRMVRELISATGLDTLTAVDLPPTTLLIRR